MRERQFPLTRLKASFAKFLVQEKGLSQTQVAILLKLNVGSVSRAVNGKRYPDAPPLDPENYPTST